MPSFDDIQLERNIREEARWLILRTLYIGRPVGAPESLILRGLINAGLPVTSTNVRNELGYLADKGLLTVNQRQRNSWHAMISAYGVDVVEYAKESPAGITRPDEV